MNIRETKLSDLDSIMKIYEHARAFMAEQGNPDQWGTSYPPEELIIDDIRNRKSYVCEENEQVVGTFCYEFGENIEPSYNTIINGHWSKNSPYGVIHRIASIGTVKGVAKYCVEWAFSRCGYMRIDTHPSNAIMQIFLNKSGFRYCGVIRLERDNTIRLAFDK